MAKRRGCMIYVGSEIRNARGDKIGYVERKKTPSGVETVSHVFGVECELCYEMSGSIVGPEWIQIDSIERWTPSGTDFVTVNICGQCVSKLAKALPNTPPVPPNTAHRACCVCGKGATSFVRPAREVTNPDPLSDEMLFEGTDPYYYCEEHAPKAGHPSTTGA